MGNNIACLECASFVSISSVPKLASFSRNTFSKSGNDGKICGLSVPTTALVTTPFSALAAGRSRSNIQAGPLSNVAMMHHGETTEAPGADWATTKDLTTTVPCVNWKTGHQRNHTSDFYPQVLTLKFSQSSSSVTAMHRRLFDTWSGLLFIGEGLGESGHRRKSNELSFAISITTLAWDGRQVARSRPWLIISLSLIEMQYVDQGSLNNPDLRRCAQDAGRTSQERAQLSPILS